MYTIVTHNAVGTVHSFVRGFDTIEAAESYWDQHHHTGLGSLCLVIDEKDEIDTRLINQKYSPLNRYVISGARKAKLQQEFYDFIERCKAGLELPQQNALDALQQSLAKGSS